MKMKDERKEIKPDGNVAQLYLGIIQIPSFQESECLAPGVAERHKQLQVHYLPY